MPSSSSVKMTFCGKVISQIPLALNANLPILVTEEGMSKDKIDVHTLKAALPISVIPLCKTTVSSDEQQ
jgi:hypothetical protein